jgi:hypothetical protein
VKTKSTYLLLSFETRSDSDYPKLLINSRTSNAIYDPMYTLDQKKYILFTIDPRHLEKMIVGLIYESKDIQTIKLTVAIG